MQIEVDTSDALPVVKWVQQVPSGKTVLETKSLLVAIGAAVLIATIGSMIFGPWGMIVGAVVGFLTYKQSEAETYRQMDQRAKHLYMLPASVDCHCEARITRSDTNELLFEWAWKEKRKGPVGRTIYLFDFDAFVTGFSYEWFGQIQEGPDEYPFFVIIIHTERYGVLPVAEHMGTRAEILQLHSVLTREFITRRREYVVQQRFAANASETAAHTTTDDVPQSDIPPAL